MTIGIDVHLKQDFSVIRETLERIGIINKKTKKFFPSLYCVETQREGVHKIVHFKELFPLFGRDTTFDDMDRLRRNTGVHLIKNWGLIDIVDPLSVDEILSEKISVLKYSDKPNYEICHKFKFSTRIVLD